MEKLLGTLAFSKVPKVERNRKREQKDEKEYLQEKKPKLLEDILNGENPPPLVPSYTTEGIEITKEKASNWKQVPLPLAKKETIPMITHWVKVGSDTYTPPTDISEFPTSVIDLTKEEYTAANCGDDEQWGFDNTKYLFALCKTYNLRWPAIIDMMSTRTTFNLDSCQLRFYKVTKRILEYRHQQNRTLTPEEDNILKYCYDSSFSKNRRLTVDRSFLVSNIINTTEKKLYERLQAIDTQLCRINNIEVTEGFGPHDDLDAIPTVMKEKPIYLKPKPGVTLRSARFDHNSASEYFNDNTSKRILQILGEMNVQIPNMATKRICDSLDRLKQDIVKLIMLRKYMAQNDFQIETPKSTVYQTNDSKKKRKTISNVNYVASTKNYSRYCCLFS